MSKDKWIQKAVPEKNKGKFTEKAEAAGKSVQEFAKEKSHSKDPTLRGEANFAMRAKKGFRGGGHVQMNNGGSSLGHRCMKTGGMC